MMYSKSLIALVAILAVFVGAPTQAGIDLGMREPLHVYCGKLNSYLSERLRTSQDPAVVYELARKKMNSVRNLSVLDRNLFSSAWKAVAYDEQCSRKTLDHLKHLEKCEPFQKPLLARTLGDSTKAYADKCLTAEFMDRELKLATSGLFATGAQELSKFLDDEFLANYRKSDGKEVHFENKDTAWNSRCCKPGRSGDAMLEKMRSVYKKEGAASNGQTVAGFLDAHLFKPCKSYRSSLSSLMEKTKTACVFIDGGDRELLPRLSQKFKDAVFRHEFCENLATREDREEFVAMVEKSLK